MPLSPARNGHKAQRERKDARAETQRLHARKRKGCTSGSATVAVAGRATVAVAGRATVALWGAQRIEVGECNAGLSHVQRMHSCDALRPPALRHQAEPLLGACVRLEVARFWVRKCVAPLKTKAEVRCFLPPPPASLRSAFKKMGKLQHSRQIVQTKHWFTKFSGGEPPIAWLTQSG